MEGWNVTKIRKSTFLAADIVFAMVLPKNIEYKKCLIFLLVWCSCSAKKQRALRKV